MKRAVKDFVKDQFRRGNSPEHIRAVARCIQYRDQMEEVDKWIEKGKEIMKKRSKRIIIRRKES